VISGKVLHLHSGRWGAHGLRIVSLSGYVPIVRNAVTVTLDSSAGLRASAAVTYHQRNQAGRTARPRLTGSGQSRLAADVDLITLVRGDVEEPVGLHLEVGGGYRQLLAVLYSGARARAAVRTTRTGRGSLMPPCARSNRQMGLPALTDRADDLVRLPS
jgi:hypothetical protein